MKTIILLFATCIFCLSIISAESFTYPDDGGRLTVTIEFGSGRDCTGWGICDLDVLYMSEGYARSFGGLGGRLQVNESDGYFELAFSKDDLAKYQPDKLVLVDGKSEVTFDEGFVFSMEVQDNLDAEKPLEIKPGTYPLKFIDGLFTIKFPY